MTLRAGCLPLAVEVGSYSGIPYSERLCNCGEVKEDQFHFFIMCHGINPFRQTLFSHCSTLSSSFAQCSDNSKCKFLTCVSDSTCILLILPMCTT